MIKKLLGLIFIVLLASCQNGRQPAKEKYSVGTLTDSIYTNEYFNIKLNIPIEWHVYPRELYDRFSEKGKEYNQSGESVEESDNILVNLLMISDKSIADSSFIRQTIMLNAEKPVNKNEYSSDLDFLKRTKNEMIKYELPITFTMGIDTITISGKNFTSFHAEFQTEKGIIHQDYMTRKENDFYINIALSYSDSTQRNDLIGLLDKNMK